jgi:hypothetical protein
MASVLAGLKYCHCTKPLFSFENARIEAAPVRELGREVWVCNTCNGIHHSRQIPMHMQRAPKQAIAVLSEAHRGNGITELTFSMIGGGKSVLLSVQPYDRRPVKMGINPNDILLKIWERLDEYTETVIEPPGDPEKAEAAHKARALAQVLSWMMPPFFTDADSIVREALRRYEHRENPDYETPGLGVKSLAALDDMPNPQRSKSGPQPTGNLIPDAALNSVRQALDLKMFTIEQIARNYEMTNQEVKEQLGLP